MTTATCITSDNLVCKILHYEQVCCFLFYRVFHYFTILWDGLFWNINDITNIPLSGAVFINCICLSYWWHTLVCKYIISIYCYTIYFTENKFICFKIWLFLLVLHHQKPFDNQFSILSLTVGQLIEIFFSWIFQ